jgi:phytoene dehydrogenase-like protein
MRKSPLSNNFDAIIMGSGIGGLTAGAFLAKQGMRVAVLEKHSRPGGCTQGFSRKGYTFDSSVHSVCMADNGFICGLLKELGVRDSITTIPNSSTARIVGADISYVLPADLAALTGSLVRDFPSETKAVPELLSDMQRLFSTYKGALVHGAGRPAAPAGKADIISATQSYGDYIGHFIRDEKLRYLFGAIWPFGGSSPSYAPVYNALIFIAHTVEGSHYIKGGFSQLAAALCRVITKNDGEVKTNWRVTGMDVDSAKRVRTVSNAAGEELSARTFVSNISPFQLHRELIPEKSRNRIWLRRLEGLRPSVSAVCVYLGIEGDPSDIAKENLTFWFGSKDHDAIYRRILSGPRGIIDHLLIMRPPESGTNSILTLIHFVKPDASADWTQEKKKIGDAMIAKAESILGRFSPRIRIMETASPATFERYTGNTGGACYGFENVKDLYGQSKLPFTTYLHNLYQAGHWTKAGGGIFNVMTSGYVVAQMILKNK